MKRLIFLFLMFVMIAGCGTSRKTVFFEKVTSQPFSIIDSLNISYNLNIPSNFKLWNKTHFIGSDSVTTTIYLISKKENKNLYIFSITEKENNKNILLKFRQE